MDDLSLYLLKHLAQTHNAGWVDLHGERSTHCIRKCFPAGREVQPGPPNAGLELCVTEWHTSRCRSATWLTKQRLEMSSLESMGSEARFLGLESQLLYLLKVWP